jgi:hypothetical protein
MARTNPVESANVREARLAYERALLDEGRADLDAVREARLAYERALLDEGRADLDAGRSLSGPALDRWLEAFIGDGELPSPASLRAATRR